MDQRNNNKPEFHDRFFKKAAVVMALIGACIIAYRIFFNLILGSGQCNNYNWYKSFELRGVVAAKYVKRYNIVEIRNGDTVVKTILPSNQLWDTALVGDSIYKRRNDIHCILVRSGQRMAMPFIDFRMECEKEDAVR